MHIGHVQLAKEAIDTLKLDALRCIPAGEPPHRNAPQANPEQRLAMVQLAFAKYPQVVVDPAEVRQTGPSWTIRTLERLRQEAPEASHVLILGADALLGLPTWHCWESLLDYAHIAVANRPDADFVASQLPEPMRSFWAKHHANDLAVLHQQPAGRLVSFTIAPCKVSATQVRQTASQGLSISGLVPQAVENYIIQHHIYTQTAH